MIKAILIDFMQRLNGVEPIKYISLDWGQLNKEKPAVKWPCALLSMEDIEFTQQAEHKQLAEADIVITLEFLHTGHMSGTVERADQTLESLETIDDIHAALSGWLPTYCGYPVRTALEREMPGEAGRERWKLRYHIAWQE